MYGGNSNCFSVSSETKARQAITLCQGSFLQVRVFCHKSNILLEFSATKARRFRFTLTYLIPIFRRFVKLKLSSVMRLTVSF